MLDTFKYILHKSYCDLKISFTVILVSLIFLMNIIDLINKETAFLNKVTRLHIK